MLFFQLKFFNLPLHFGPERYHERTHTRSFRVIYVIKKNGEVGEENLLLST